MNRIGTRPLVAAVLSWRRGTLLWLALSLESVTCALG